MTTFKSPFDKLDPRNGQECRIMKSLPVADGTVLTIRFDDGFELQVWAEEVQEA